MFKSPCIVTDKVVESRKFYRQFFNARVTFDCGWYVGLRFGEAEVEFMKPKAPGHHVFSGTGLAYAIRVRDVDRMHARLANAGLPTANLIGNHPWLLGGFSVLDPNGIQLCFYQE